MTDPAKNGKDVGDEAPVDVEFTPPSYVLKAKSPPTGKPLTEALQEAGAALDDLANDYPLQALARVADLEGALHALPADGAAGDALGKIYAIAHEMRGLGGTFGFPLVTDIADSLCALLEDRTEASAPLREAIGVHVDSLRLVLSEPIIGDGGARGTELLDGLRNVSASKGQKAT